MPKTQSAELQALVLSFRKFERACVQTRPNPPPRRRELPSAYGSRVGMSFEPPLLFNLLWTLPTVPIDETLPNWSCPVCLGELAPRTGCNPVRLPCNHICGDLCVRRWFGDGNATLKGCPICRQRLYGDDDIPEKIIDVLEIAMDEKMWADHELGTPLDETHRRLLLIRRAVAVDHRIHKWSHRFQRALQPDGSTRRLSNGVLIDVDKSELRLAERILQKSKSRLLDMGLIDGRDSEGFFFVRPEWVTQDDFFHSLAKRLVNLDEADEAVPSNDGGSSMPGDDSELETSTSGSEGSPEAPHRPPMTSVSPIHGSTTGEGDPVQSPQALLSRRDSEC